LLIQPLNFKVLLIQPLNFKVLLIQPLNFKVLLIQPLNFKRSGIMESNFKPVNPTRRCSFVLRSFSVAFQTEATLQIINCKYTVKKKQTSFQVISFCQTCIKGALNLNFLNLTINKEKNFGSRNVLVPFVNLLLLKSYKGTSPLTSIPKSS